MKELAGFWFDRQCSALVQSAILASGLLILDLASRRRAWPELRHALWLLVLVNVMLPPSLTAPWAARHAAEWALLHVRSSQSVSPALGRLEMQSRPTPSAAVAAVDITATPALRQRRPDTAGLGHVIHALTVKETLFMLWLTGSILLATAGIVLMTVMRRRLCPADGSPPPDELSTMLSRLAKDVALRRRPDLIVTDALGIPAVIGVLRPRILLPRRLLTSLSPVQMEHVLLHEILHIKRGHHLLLFLHLVLVVVYWPNPVIWLLLKPLRELRETCCDLAVTHHLGGRVQEYCRTLLFHAGGDVAPRLARLPALGLLGLFHRQATLVTRIRILQQRPRQGQRLRRLVSVAAALCLGGYVLPMGGRASEAAPARDTASLASNTMAREERVQITVNAWITSRREGTGSPDLLIAPRLRAFAGEQAQIHVEPGLAAVPSPGDSLGFDLLVTGDIVEGGVKLTGRAIASDVLGYSPPVAPNETTEGSLSVRKLTTVFALIVPEGVVSKTISLGRRGPEELGLRLQAQALPITPADGAMAPALPAAPEVTP